MIIKEASENDIPFIVDLLKKSLGESLLPKSERFWRWKHMENPFGKSPLLVSYDGEKLVGVRAFMSWRWRTGKNFKEAVRAVDTATHPEYQGKGIFTKLTKKLLEECSQQNKHFVFNTPNEKSKPGYLKMGWEEAGRLPVSVKLVRPGAMLLNMIARQNETTVDPEKNGNMLNYLKHPDVDALLDKHQSNFGDDLISAHTAKSLQWRYCDVPVAQYYAEALFSSSHMNSLFFYRIKPSRTGNELRVTDIFIESEKCRDDVYNSIMEKAKHHKAHYVTVAGDYDFLKGLFSFRKLSVGPVVTVRQLANMDMKRLHDFQQWAPSLGDLELF